MDILVIHSLYIPYIFPRYVPCIFPCVFLNLWSQEKTSPYRKTTEIFFFRFYTFYIVINHFMTFHQNIHQTHRPNVAAAEGGACVSDGYIYGYLWLYHKYLWIY